MSRVCPKHYLELDDKLRCARCRRSRVSWLVTDAQGRVIAAGRIEGYREPSPVKDGGLVWFGPSIDDVEFLLHTLARQVDQDPRHERELAEMPWGDE